MLKKNRNEKGQIAVMMVLSVLSLAMMWMMAVNMGKLVSDRIMMQNAADSSAYTAATLKAQSLNQLGFYNNSLAGMLVFSDLASAIGLGNVKICWFPYLNSQAAYAAYQSASTLLDMLNVSSGIYILKEALSVARRQRIVNGSSDGADWIIPGSMLSFNNPLDFVSSGLTRKKESVHFCNTVIIYGVPVPVPGSQKKVKTWFYHKYDTGPRASVVTAVKRYSKADFLPMGRKFFGISKMPTIYTVAAARPYNPKGSMFPVGEGGKAVGVIAKYVKGANGWKAQLVPAGSLYQH